MNPLAHLLTRHTPAPEPAPTPPPTVGNAVAAVRRAKRIAEARTPAEWLEAQLEWCPARGCDLVIRDANGSRGSCGPGCMKRREIGGGV